MKQSIMSQAKDYFFITVSLMLYTFGVVAFLIPAKVVSGGATGISTLVFFMLGEKVPFSILFLIINSIFVGIGMKIFGTRFAMKTVFAILTSTLMLQLWAMVLPAELLVDNIFMNTIIGGMCLGAGVGFAISQGGSTGGTDVIALIVNKYWNIPTGRTILYVDMIIISSAYFVFKEIAPVIYGFSTMAVTAYFIDFVISGRKQSVQFFIFTQKYEEVAEYIAKEVNRGVSLLDSYGWYSKENRKIVMVLAKKSESRQIFKLVKKIDSSAFISMNSVSGVYGSGFERIN